MPDAPTIPPEPVARFGRGAGRARPRRSWLARTALWLTGLALALGALLAGLLLLYRVEAIHPWSTLMVAQRLSGVPVTRTWVELDDVSPFLVRGVILSEDGQYCAHDGVDWGALRAEVDDALEGESPRGASTIAMQSVKNLYLWPGRSLVRKALEVPLALAADRVWRKRRLMELYLNVAEWGPGGVFGIEQAARHHFGVSARDLTKRQAALLAVTLPNPHLRDPARPGRAMTALADRVQRLSAKGAGYAACTRPGA